MRLNPLFLALALSAALSACSGIRPSDLRCEYMAEPNSIDTPFPRLSWVNEARNGREKGQYQTAWQVRASGTREGLGKAELWDSGKVEGDDSYLVSYGGKSPASGRDCWWQVRVWDKSGRASGWSEPARWTAGMLDPDGLDASWIGAPWYGEEADSSEDRPAPIFRKQFRLKSDPVSARAFVTGLGYFEFYANGGRVGDECLAPNFTNYGKRDGLDRQFIGIEDKFRDYRVMYLVYDLTDRLSEGDNSVGLLVGNGWYNTHGTRWPSPYGSPRMICRIEVEYADGSSEAIVSDTSWQVRPSAIVLNDEYRGEVYDARLEDSEWSPVVLRKAPEGTMTASSAPLDRVTRSLRPLSFEKTEEGYELDFGEDISGWLRFRGVSGSRGDTLRVRFISDQPVGDEVYIFGDEECRDYAPRFTWYVFRRAVVTGVDGLTADNVCAEMVNTDLPYAAEFECSNELFNQINEIWRRTQMDNMHGGIASDCPHREKSPYTGDGQVVCATVMSNFDAAAFYAKWIRDVRDSQNTETGYVPNAAPWQPGCGGGVAWGAAMNIMPWEFYRHYGDLDFLASNYDAMKAQLGYMCRWITPDGTMHARIESTAPFINGPNYWMNLGEWCAPYGNPSDELVHTFYLWLCADVTARAAEALGTWEQQEFRSLADSVKAAFHKKFYDPSAHSYGKYGADVFAMYMGVPEDRKSRVLASLERELRDSVTSTPRLTTGIFGTRYLFEVLARNGLNDLAYEIMSGTEYPGFGYWISQGATTMWEHWDGRSSRNHPMFGGCLTWFYECLAGVNIDETSPAYRHSIISPVPASGLDNVRYSVRTPYGCLSSDVSYSGDGSGVLKVTIPVGCTATIMLPDGSESFEVCQGNHIFKF